MATFTKSISGKQESPGHGTGLKSVISRVVFGPNSEGLSASDFDLRTLWKIDLPSHVNSRGSALIGSVANPGSPDNYASFSLINFGTGSIATAKTAGSVNTVVTAWGE